MNYITAGELSERPQLTDPLGGPSLLPATPRHPIDASRKGVDALRDATWQLLKLCPLLYLLPGLRGTFRLNSCKCFLAMGHARGPSMAPLFPLTRPTVPATCWRMSRWKQSGFQ